MFDKLKLTEYSLEDGGSTVGLVKANLKKLYNNKFASLITSDKQKYQVKQIGRVNYAYLDAFIIKSMNDYYQKVSNTTTEEKATYIKNYNRLYQSWQAINEAKKHPDITLNDLYDAILYELYMLGYHE